MRRLLPATLAVALVLLAGCSGDDDPEPRISPTDSSSVASTPTPSPTPTGPVEPTLPPEAEGDDAAAAVAFTGHFWEMVNYAQSTGEVTGLQRLAATGCIACKGGTDQIERVYGAGGSMRGGQFEIVRSTSKPFESGPSKGFLVTVDVEVSPQRVVVPGEKDQKFAGGPGKIQLVLERIDGAWMVQRWDSL